MVGEGGGDGSGGGAGVLVDGSVAGLERVQISQEYSDTVTQ